MAINSVVNVREDNIKKVMEFIVENTNKFGVCCSDIADKVDKEFPKWQEWVTLPSAYVVATGMYTFDSWKSENQWMVTNKTEDECKAAFEKDCKDVIKGVQEMYKLRRVPEDDELFQNPIMDSTKVTKACTFEMRENELSDGEQHFGYSRRARNSFAELMTAFRSHKSGMCVHVSFIHREHYMYGEYTVTFYPISRTTRKVAKNKNAPLLIKDIDCAPMQLSGKIFGFNVDDVSYYNNSLDMRLHTATYAHEDISQLIDIVNAVSSDPEKLKKFNTLKGLGKASFMNLMKLYFLQTITQKDLDSIESYGDMDGGYLTAGGAIIRLYNNYTMDDVSDAIDILQKKYDSFLKSQAKK